MKEKEGLLLEKCVLAVSLTCPPIPLPTGVFALMNAYIILRYFQFYLTEKQFQTLFSTAIVSAGVVFMVMIGLTYLGYIAPWKGHIVAAGLCMCVCERVC